MVKAKLISRFITSFLALSLCLFSLTVSAFDFKKRPNDLRQFDYVELNNGLKVLVISDDTATKSAASLDVFVGSGEDPEDLNGLAHFLEHMLFLGSEKYPDAGSFDGYVAGHGGSHNAYTSLQHTNYFFDIESNAFFEGLDRFSSMFISPLLSEEYIAREVNAVHSEFTSRYTNDHRRRRDVISELVSQDNMLSKFPTGNKDTLNAKDAAKLQASVKAFYQKYYKAELMTLVLYGPETTEKLKEWAKQLFHTLPSGNVPAFLKTDKLFAPGALPARATIVPHKELRTLSLLFPIPETKPYIKQKPVEYIGHLVGHEGEGSLLSVLRGAGLAYGLGVGNGSRWRGGETFNVEIKLTEKGSEQVELIEALFFESLKKIQSKGINQWRYDELKNIGLLGFEFGEKIDPIHEVMWFSSKLHDNEPENLLLDPYNYADFDPGLIKRYLSFINKNNLFSILMAPGVKHDRVSDIYNVSYSVASLNAGLRVEEGEEKPKVDSSLSLKALTNQLALPERNRFIPDEFALIDSGEQEIPRLIYNRKSVNGWFANDNTFDLPKAKINVRMNLPLVAEDPSHFAVAHTFANMIKESLSETSYNANVGGLSYSLSANYRGLSLEFSGYNDTLYELINTVQQQMIKYQKKSRFRTKINQDFFQKVKTDLSRKAKNKLQSKPSSQIFREIPAVIYKPYWSADDVYHAFDNLTLEQYEATFATLFDHAAIDVLVFGNVDKRYAKKVIKKVSRLKTKGKLKAESTSGLVKQIDEHSKPLLRYVETSENDSAVVLYIQGASDSFTDQAKVAVMQQMLATPFFSKLRTEQQLGYIVYATEYSIKHTPGIVAVVQSPDKSVEDIYKHIDAFLREHKSDIFAHFERDKKSVLVAHSEKEKNQAELSAYYWSQIVLGNEKFDDKESFLSAVSGISAQDMSDFYTDAFILNKRNIVFVSTSNKDELNGLSHSFETINDLQKFKNTGQFFTYP